MKLSELFTYMTYGEFAQLNIGIDDAGMVSDKDYPTLVSHINLGLTNLFSRLNLKQGKLQLQTSTTRNTYPLIVEHAVTSKVSGYEKFILDSPSEIYTGDLLKVEEILDADGNVLPLNKRETNNRITTVEYNVLNIENPIDGILTVNYRAGHKALPVKQGIDPESTVINIPSSLVEALLLYAASRVSASRVTLESQQQAAGYMSRYEQAVTTYGITGQVFAVEDDNTRFFDNGWV